MTKAAFLFFIFISFSTASGWAQPESKQFSGLVGVRSDSAALLKAWLSDILTLSERDTAAAFVQLRDALKESGDQKNQYATAHILRTLGHINSRIKMHNRAFGNYLNSQKVFIELNDNREVAYATFFMAREQYHRGVYRFAIKDYMNAIALAEQENLIQLQAEALENLGLLYNSFQIFGSGTASLRTSMQLKKDLKDEPGMLRIAEMLSQDYYRQRQFDSSLYFANYSLQLATKLNRPTDVYMAKLSKIAASMRLKQWNETDILIEEIRDSRNSFGQDLNLKIRYWIINGNYYLMKNDITIANNFYDSAIGEALLNVFPELQLLTYSNMAETYYDLKKYKPAFEYQQKCMEIISSIYVGENAINLQNLETVVKSNASSDEIKYLSMENKVKQLQLLNELEMRKNLEKENLLKDSLLLKEKLLGDALESANDFQKKQLSDESQLRESLARTNDLQKEKLSQERILRLSLIIGLSTALILGGIILSQFLRQRKKSMIIAKQSEEMQTLMKEIHHRVKNNLQVISSLLDLQSISIRDQQAAEAVKEGKNRVQSMALIHQDLYNERNIKGISVKHYIDSLTQGLFHSYNIKQGRIELHTDIDDLTLDVDTVIPIGLILNELISNSLKYAFKNKESGHLWVSLKKEEKSLLLKVKDNGPGFPSEFNWNNSQSFGMKLIRAFTQKLKARMEVYNDHGACVEMNIMKYKPTEGIARTDDHNSQTILS